MVRDFDIYQVGYRLGAVRDFLRGSRETTGPFSRLEQTLATVAVSTSGMEPHGKRERDVNTDEYFVARIALGILQRGISSLTSPSLERAILAASTSLDWDLSPDDAAEVNFELLVSDSTEAARLRDALVSAQVASDSRVDADWLAHFDSGAEAIFFERHLAALLGPGLALVEAQRPIQSMLDSDNVAAREFTDQRVDFALETPTRLKVVFEVDGPHHQDPTIQRLDRKRDAALRNAGWHVERIPVSALRAGEHPFSAEVRKRIEADGTLRDLRAIDHESSDPVTFGVDAMRLVMTPHAVARLQLAILLALMDGTLLLSSNEWTIAVVERDIRCAYVAVLDLLDGLSHLCTLYGIDWAPTVNLVVRDETNLGLPSPAAEFSAWRHANAVTVEEVTAEGLIDQAPACDLLIDVSVRARPADKFPTDQQHRAALEVARRSYELRTAYRRAPEQFKPWPLPRALEYAERHTDALTYFLQMIFRKRDFREKQIEIIARAMGRKSVVGLLPTGSGKSITFQLPAMLSPGVALVIAPLRSLMDDQVDNLHRTSINRNIAVHSGLGQNRKEAALRQLLAGYPRLVYIAPERFLSARFRTDLVASPLAGSVSFVVVDEAHCVSEWGHDFRPAYLNVGRLARDLCSGLAGEPPLIALTGTASRLVLLDIQRELEIDLRDIGSVVSTERFNRPELSFLPLSSGAGNKLGRLFEALNDMSIRLDQPLPDLLADPRNGGIVFCRHVNGEFGVVHVASALRRELKLASDAVQIYCGAVPKGFPETKDEWDRHRERVQRAFKDNAFSVLVATHGFGMGIDKANIRFTTHYGIPQSIEALAQEAGRAGRDRNPSVCAIVFTDGPDDFLDLAIPAEEANRRANAYHKSQASDASRLMYFHSGSFQGADEDFKDTAALLDVLRDAWHHDATTWGSRLDLTISRNLGSKGADRVEKAIYRLSLLGLIEDYTTDWKSSFSIHTCHLPVNVAEYRLGNYVRRYRPPERADVVVANARVEAMGPDPYNHLVRALCTFIYEEIETARRRSIRDLIEAMRKCDDDGAKLAEAIDVHLSKNIFSGRIFEMVSRVDPKDWWGVLDDVETAYLAPQLLGSCRRALEAAPDHPGLLIIEAIGSAWLANPDPRQISESLSAGLKSMVERYGTSEQAAIGIAFGAITRICQIDQPLFERIAWHMVLDRKNTLFARAAYASKQLINRELRRACAVPWITSITHTSRTIREQHQGISHDRAHDRSRRISRRNSEAAD